MRSAYIYDHSLYPIFQLKLLVWYLWLHWRFLCSLLERRSASNHFPCLFIHCAAIIAHYRILHFSKSLKIWFKDLGKIMRSERFGNIESRHCKDLCNSHYSRPLLKRRSLFRNLVTSTAACLTSTSKNSMTAIQAQQAFVFFPFSESIWRIRFNPSSRTVIDKSESRFFLLFSMFAAGKFTFSSFTLLYL